LSGNNWQGNLDLDMESDLPGLGMVAGLQVVPTNAVRRLELDLDLDPEILTYQSGIIGYELNLQKQLGLKELPFEFSVTIPKDYKFIDCPECKEIEKKLVIHSMKIRKTNELILFLFSK